MVLVARPGSDVFVYEQLVDALQEYTLLRARVLQIVHKCSNYEAGDIADALNDVYLFDQSADYWSPGRVRAVFRGIF